MLEGYCSGRTKGKHTPCCNSVDILAWVDQYYVRDIFWTPHIAVVSSKNVSEQHT